MIKKMKSVTSAGLEKKTSQLEVKTERHNYAIDIKAIESTSDDKFFIVTGYATKWFGIDTYGDQIRPGAYKEFIAKNQGGLPALFMHDNREMPMGLWFSFKEDDTGLLVQARLPKDDVFVSGRLVPQMRAGSVDALSIGFRPTKVSFEEIDGEMIRILEGIDLREISFIVKGLQADSGALLTDLKKNQGRTVEEIMVNAMVEMKRHGIENDQKKKEIIEYYQEKERLDPFNLEAVVSVEELKNLSKSNRVWAIRKLNLSAKASQHLAELMEVPKGSPITGSEGVDEKSEGKPVQNDGTDTVAGDKTPEDMGRDIEEGESKATHNALDNLLEVLTKITK
jgi:HK97 family phage prohead protease